MKKICITFSGGQYDATTKKIVENAPLFGADKVVVYDDVWLLEQKEFCERNKWVFEHHHKRGFGWYIWKPFVIIHALEQAEDGDIVLFTDADCYPIADLSPLYEICQKDGIMLFSAAAYNNRQFCKRDCFIAMDQDEPKYHDAQAGVARFMLFQKGSWLAHQFLSEWLTYSVNKHCNTFDPSVLAPELDGFIEHRCEQAIMTNLAHKYGCRLYREADQSGDQFKYDWELFPTVFHQDGAVAVKHKNMTVPALGSSYRNVRHIDKNMRELARVLRDFIPAHKVKTVFEMGAKDCSDTLALHDLYHGADVYAFECNPDTLPKCRKKVAGIERIHLTEKAVSDKTGSVTFYPIDTEKTKTPHRDGNPGASSMFKATGKYPKEQYVQKKVTVPAVSLSDFMDEKKIPGIDLLWLDTQGAEIKVLTGLKEKLAKVKVIHTEVNFMEIYAGQPLFEEVKAFLEKNGFEFICFTSKEEHFGDAVFVHSSIQKGKAGKALAKAKMKIRTFSEKARASLKARLGL